MKRDIQHILNFRADISPFLVHLTKEAAALSAKEVLKKIIDDNKLIPGPNAISDARFYSSDENEFCRAISFTETPLNEIHCLLDIEGRSVDLECYGLVFLKKKLRERGVSPVIYLNNELKDKVEVIEAMCKLETNDPDSAKQILPLISTFGKKLLTEGDIDFLWEREWRYPSVKGDFQFSEDDIFIGICPNDEIEEFEVLFQGLKFVDCQRNMKWYANKLIESRKKHPDIRVSVI